MAEPTQAQPLPRILGVRINPTSYAEAVRLVTMWSAMGEHRYVCTANVHMLMEAQDDDSFRAVLDQADLVTPDGMPLVWLLRWKGHKRQERVYGPTLTRKTLAAAETEDIPVGFFGSSPEVIDRLRAQLRRDYPGLRLVLALSPPFGEFDPGENAAMVAEINRSGASILFVGLGCPKQERWMHANKSRVQAVMLGVGAAFDFIAGVKSQAPLWVQRSGMEWFYRLVTEPKRLGKRYLYHNPRFMAAAAGELIRERLKRKKEEE